MNSKKKHEVGNPASYWLLNLLCSLIYLQICCYFHLLFALSCLKKLLYSDWKSSCGGSCNCKEVRSKDSGWCRFWPGMSYACKHLCNCNQISSEHNCLSNTWTVCIPLHSFWLWTCDCAILNIRLMYSSPILSWNVPIDTAKYTGPRGKGICCALYMSIFHKLCLYRMIFWKSWARKPN